MNSIKTLEEMKEIRRQLKDQNKKVVFTNGCFDLIHAGHIDYLSKAKAFGDDLVVGLNSDASVMRIKGSKRPILKETERSFIISNLKPVDYVMLFDEDTPKRLIEELLPSTKDVEQIPRAVSEEMPVEHRVENFVLTVFSV